jgi:hypothetical protein
MSTGKSSGAWLSQDVISGALVIMLGGGILAALSGIGTAKYQQIAPDLFPRLCAYALVLGGGVLLLRGLAKGSPRFEPPHLRALALIVFAVCAFGALTPVFGYAPAGFLTMVIGGLAAPEMRFRQLLLVSAGLVFFSIGLFSYLLKLPIPILALPGIVLPSLGQ